MEPAQIITLVISILSFLGVSTIISQFWKDKYEQKKQQTEQAKQRQKKQKQEEMREVVREEMKPIEKRMEKIEENTEQSLKADVLSLRCNMKAIEERCKAQGYADIGDKATMKKLRKQYEDLGGNDFKDYVNHWCEIVENLPDDKEGGE